jgi:flagellar protein FlgJ
MEVNPLQRSIIASDIAPERLAGNSRLTQDQKIAEASRQFEAVMLRQILSDSQKTVISSEFSDNSTAAGIYQDLMTNTLADNISKSGRFGLAKVFEQQLSRPSGTESTSGQQSMNADLTGAVFCKQP